jgi:hypothetical protein
MPIRPQPMQPPLPPVRARGPARVSGSGEQLKSFAETEREHAQQVEEQVSGKRKRETTGPSVAGGTRGERPRSGRSGSRSNASHKTRGH